MDRTPKDRPDATPRDPFRQARGSYEPFGSPGNGSRTPPPTDPVPPEDSLWEPSSPPPPPARPTEPPPRPEGPGPDIPRGPEPDWQRLGWDDYDLGSPPPNPIGRAPDLSILVAFVEALRRLVPGDLQGQFNSLLREVLKTLRSLIDWYLERLDSPGEEPEVEDIPID
jgi:hypothetical protein